MQVQNDCDTKVASKIEQKIRIKLLLFYLDVMKFEVGLSQLKGSAWFGYFRSLFPFPPLLIPPFFFFSWPQLPRGQNSLNPDPF